MPKRLIGYDASGNKIWHDFDHSSRKGYIGHEPGNLQPVLDWTHHLRTSGIKDINRKSWKHHVACIPDWVQVKWLNEDGISLLNPDHWPRIKAKLNDPDYAFLRTGGGRL